MKKYPKLYKPENYNLTEVDIKNINEFDSLLNHLTNTVASEPIHKIGLNKIGIGNLKAMVNVQNIDSPKTFTPILCEIDAGVDLKINRGIHMSRLVDSVFLLTQKQFKDLDEFAVELAKMIKQKQESNKAFVKIKATYIHKRHTRKTSLTSYDTIHPLSHVSIIKDSIQIKTGMKVYNATACPCTKTYTKYSIVPGLKELGLNLSQIQKILDLTVPASHMQLGTTTLVIDKEKSDITPLQIYEVLNNSLHIVYELLKRDDEHEFVKRAIDKSQFTEDAARDVAYNAYQSFKNKLSDKAEIYIKSILQDSIHTHDVRTTIQKTFGEIEKELHQ